jgi:hypothetical protein
MIVLPDDCETDSLLFFDLTRGPCATAGHSLLFDKFVTTPRSNPLSNLLFLSFSKDETDPLAYMIPLLCVTFSGAA